MNNIYNTKNIPLWSRTSVFVRTGSVSLAILEASTSRWVKVKLVSFVHHTRTATSCKISTQRPTANSLCVRTTTSTVVDSFLLFSISAGDCPLQNPIARTYVGPVLVPVHNKKYRNTHHEIRRRICCSLELCHRLYLAGM